MASLFDRNPQGQTSPHGNPVLAQIRQNPRAYLGQLKENPAGFLRRFGYNIPDGMTDPRQIIQTVFGNPPHGRR